MKLLDFKTNLTLETKLDALFSVPGTYNVINFWQFLPCQNFPELRKFAQSCIRTVARKSSIGKFYVIAGGLGIENLIKIPLIYNVS